MSKAPSLSLISLCAAMLLFPSTMARTDESITKESIAAAVAEIRQIQSQIRQAVSVNRQPDPALSVKIKEIALGALKGITPNSAPLSAGSDLVELYSLAGDEKSAAAIARRLYDQQGSERMQLSARIVRNFITEDNFREAQRHIRFTDFSFGPSLIGQFHANLKPLLFQKAGTRLKQVLDIYDELIARLRFGSDLTESDKNWTPYAYADVLSDKLTLLYTYGRRSEAVQGFKKLQNELKRYPKSTNAHGGGAIALVESKLNRLTAEESQTGLIGKAAPTLIVSQHLNEFEGLESFKGKVVILDFMAHWCGPCKAALPALAQLQDELGSQGVQVVSLTSFYGYYGTKQGISKDEEFTLMKNFIKEFNISWPLLFDSTGKNNINYGVSGIPHLVVIDRKGIVRKIEVGFTPAAFAEMRKLIERLSAE